MSCVTCHEKTKQYSKISNRRSNNFSIIYNQYVDDADLLCSYILNQYRVYVQLIKIVQKFIAGVLRRINVYV